MKMKWQSLKVLQHVITETFHCIRIYESSADDDTQWLGKMMIIEIDAYTSDAFLPVITRITETVKWKSIEENKFLIIKLTSCN